MAEKSRSKPLILIIEDEGLISRMYSKKLESDGYDCLTATNGQDGLTIAKDKKPDLIVCDIMMPVMDGIAVLKELKDTSETKSIPVIMLTNLADDKYVDEALEIGAVSYLIKSQIVPADVVKEIKEKLEAAGKKSLLSKVGGS